MICKAECFGGSGYLPVMFIEGGENDLAFGLGLQRFQGAGFSRGIRRVVAVFSVNFRRDIGDVDDGGIGSNHHPLDKVAEFAHIVLLPTVTREQRENIRRDGLWPHAELRGDRADQMIDENRDVR